MTGTTTISETASQNMLKINQDQLDLQGITTIPEINRENEVYESPSSGKKLNIAELIDSSKLDTVVP